MNATALGTASWKAEYQHLIGKFFVDRIDCREYSIQSIEYDGKEPYVIRKLSLASCQMTSYMSESNVSLDYVLDCIALPSPVSANPHAIRDTFCRDQIVIQPPQRSLLGTQFTSDQLQISAGAIERLPKE
jgi:hypothetical protein